MGLDWAGRSLGANHGSRDRVTHVSVFLGDVIPAAPSATCPRRGSACGAVVCGASGSLQFCGSPGVCFLCWVVYWVVGVGGLGAACSLLPGVGVSRVLWSVAACAVRWVVRMLWSLCSRAVGGFRRGAVVQLPCGGVACVALSVRSVVNARRWVSFASLCVSKA